MKTSIKTVLLGAIASSALAAPVFAEDVNVAFFLQWPTPNLMAKESGAYADSMGVDVNWTDFTTGTAMTEAMLAGDIDISYSQGLAPFVTAIQQGAPLKMVGIAVVYEANDCFVRNGLGIDGSNASELEGKTVAVPLNTMADYAFRSYMTHYGVDIDTMTIVDQAPADGAKSLADGAVDMACVFGGVDTASAAEVGTAIMSSEQKVEANIGSFDIISVTESFATQSPELVQAFMDATAEANQAWTGSDEQIAMVAAASGMNVDQTRTTIEGFIIPTVDDQKMNFFNEDGSAASAAASLGLVFSETDLDVASTIDSSFLE
jgi:taurine transport system substrate-binding protein